MLEIFGKNYYIDVDEIIEKCRPTYPIKETEPVEPIDGEPVAVEQGGLELNVFKFEILKACLERTLNEYEEVDEKMGAFAENALSPSFKIAINTLLKYDILKEDNNE